MVTSPSWPILMPVAAAGALALLLTGITLTRTRKRETALAESAIVEALAQYVCGNRETARLRALAAAYPAQVRDLIRRYQGVISAGREELAALSIELGVTAPGGGVDSANQTCTQEGL